MLVVVSSSLRSDPRFSSLIQRLETQDPGFVQTISVIGLFDTSAGALAPGLLTDFVMSYDELPWLAPFSVQAQLKRLADLFVATVLLLITAPSLLLRPC